MTNINKVEFLACIQDIRKQAFKVDTIKSSFKKTGIWPFNPQVVLEKIDERHGRSTTPLSTPLLGSSPIGTPVNLRKIWKVGSSIERLAKPGINLMPEHDIEIDTYVNLAITLTPENVRDISRFVKGGVQMLLNLFRLRGT